MGEFLDDNIVCPVSGGRLEPVGASPISAASGRRYAIDDGIPRLFVDDAEGVEAPIPDLARGDRVTHAVQTFYEDAPFPNYNDFNSLETFVRRADAGIFARLLREQVPMNSTVLEVGCRTGQLINYLGATTMARVYAADMTLPSLELGHAFATQHGINGVRFMQMNLFRPCIREVSMDFVVSNGVLHHTADARRAFLSIARLVKPGGFILVGLYDKIGRLRTDFRRVLYRHFGEWVLALDPHLRRNLSPAKRRAWIQDQYRHPQETKHTMSETLEWFAAAGFSFVSSIPGITKRLSASERLFEPHDLGTAFDRFVAEVEMLFSYGREGGLFIMIGRRSK